MLPLLRSCVLVLLLFCPFISAQFPNFCLGSSLLCAIQINARLWPPLPSRRADCSSYQRVTVTPDSSIVTTTVATTTTTITVVQPPGGAGLTARGELVARATTVTPTAIPTYLSGPCRLPNAYRGACSCMGIRPTTTTAPTPTSTTSITHTVTETVTAECAPIAEECSDISTTPCPNSPLGCFCGRRSDGGESCVQPGGSCLTIPRCQADSDCSADERCITSHCCSGGGGVCFRARPDGCGA